MRGPARLMPRQCGWRGDPTDLEKVCSEDPGSSWGRGCSCVNALGALSLWWDGERHPELRA